MCKRLQVDYLDVLFSHRHDHETPIEETCRAFNQVIEDGLAFYWGTSEWTSAQIVEAIQVCERNNFHKPVVEQPQYNMLVRDKFEAELGFVFDRYKYGSTIWSPLLQGVLTGKYNKEIPDQSRFGNPEFPARLRMTFNKMFSEESKEKTLKMFADMEQIAKELGGTQAQLAMAWCLNNKNVSTAITGASRPEQLVDTCGSIQMRKKFTPEIEQRLEAILNNTPDHGFNYKLWSPAEKRRPKVVIN